MVQIQRQPDSNIAQGKVLMAFSGFSILLKGALRVLLWKCWKDFLFCKADLFFPAYIVLNHFFFFYQRAVFFFTAFAASGTVWNCGCIIECIIVCMHSSNKTRTDSWKYCTKALQVVRDVTNAINRHSEMRLIFNFHFTNSFRRASFRGTKPTWGLGLHPLPNE